ncbi:dTDP-4-dehydrorhamnose 3,5-epimerase, partial [Lacticaseibacillus paracasei]|nr:dTDP-4-dehydrorhamnose 3,5-epimerase [Lacticaseibacillus paracasei]MDT8655182.1 dTDP-4-dehydrorhamnose 3,5-epimerase [Lacticaseibacillus paracasei]
MSLKVIPTKLQDVKLVETDVFGDNRGFFTET